MRRGGRGWVASMAVALAVCLSAASLAGAARGGGGLEGGAPLRGEGTAGRGGGGRHLTGIFARTKLGHSSRGPGGAREAVEKYHVNPAQAERAGAEGMRNKDRASVQMGGLYADSTFSNPSDVIASKLKGGEKDKKKKGGDKAKGKPASMVGRISGVAQQVDMASQKANATMWYVDNNPAPKSYGKDPVGDITFVAFFVGDNYDPMAIKRVRMCFQSAKMYHPKARIVFMTDSTTDLSALEELGGHVKVHRVIQDHAFREKSHMMLHRMQAELSYLEQVQAANAHDHTSAHDTHPHVVFMDTDVFFLRPLTILSKGGFHLAMAVDNSKPKSPIEMGLRMVHRSQVHRAQTFWRAAVSAMLARGKGLSFDQDRDSVWDVFRQSSMPPVTNDDFAKKLRKQEPIRQKVVLTRQMIDVMLLPCSDYSAVPSKSEKKDGCKPTSHSSVMHFKGGLKEGMNYYWDYIKADHSGSDVQMDAFRRKWEDEIEGKHTKKKKKKGL